MTIPPIAGILFPEALAVARSLDEMMANWRQVVITSQPTANADYVRTVCEEIVRRAQIISQSGPVEFARIANFFLDRTQAWVLGGLPVSAIGAKLPKNLQELGFMVMQENVNPLTGGPITPADLKHASENGRLRIQ